ncbi:hypothetical protein [Archaeoglobus sp.]|nr:hypothetical protein [Archaeoglobus sp.]
MWHGKDCCGAAGFGNAERTATAKPSVELYAGRETVSPFSAKIAMW